MSWDKRKRQVCLGTSESGKYVLGQAKAASSLGQTKVLSRRARRKLWYPTAIIILLLIQVLPVDPLVAITMTNAAKRDSNCELHDLVNHHNFECTLRSGLPDHIPLSVYTIHTHSSRSFSSLEIHAWGQSVVPLRSVLESRSHAKLLLGIRHPWELLRVVAC